MNRKKVVLLGLLVVLIMALIYAFFAMPKQERAVREASVSQKASRNAHNEHQRVKIELLEDQVGEFTGVQRDLFGPLFPPPKVVKRPPPPPVVIAPPPPVIKPPTPVEIVRRELARFTFMGYLRKQERWTIFLSAGEDIFLVQEGDRFGRNNEFHAVAITPEQLVVEQATQGEIIIPLVEKQPLVPSTFSSPSARPARADTDLPSSVTQPAVAPRTGGRTFNTNPFRATGSPLAPSRPVPVRPVPNGVTTNEEVTDEQ